MSSLFRGALNLLQGDVPGSTGGSHPLVGQDVEVGNVRLRIKSLIAEGGFAVVFSAQDQQGHSFALKRQLANDKEAVQAVISEINTLKEINGHPNIVRFIQAAQSKSPNGGAEFLLLTELCSEETVVDLLKASRLSPSNILKIFHSACSAVKHMHCREKPITHRDIKIENLLFDLSGHVKLCDFGSATREVHYPNDDWTPLRRTQLIEEMQRNTTPMYRAPEVQDEYMNMPVGPQQDVWALGCVLFYLCYRVHPFEDSAKLRIVNAKYSIPADDQEYTMFVPLIQSCLQPDPRHRPTISDLLERTSALAAAMDIDPTKSVEGLTAMPSQQNLPPSNPFPAGSSNSGPPPRPPPPKNEADMSQQASAMFGALKGQGMSLFKNIKDRSAAVVQTVQTTYGGRGPDVTWLTSRIMMAPQSDNVPEALAGQAEEALRNFSSEQARPYLMVNVSQRRLKCEFPATPIDSLFPTLTSGQTPTLNQLLKLCRSMIQFLRQNPNGFVVVYGLEPHCVLVSVSLILYSRLLPRPMNALEMVNMKRSTVALQPSSHRCLDLLTKVVTTPPQQIRQNVHNRTTELVSLSMEPIPLFNRLRTGCRPFAEIYSAGNRLWNTCKDYEQLTSFEVPESSSVELNLGSVPVCDDVTIVVYHARWSKMHNRMQQVVMFSAGFHANFWDPSKTKMTLHRGDLDLNPEEARNIPQNFRVILGLKIGNADRGFNNGVAEPPAFLGYDPESVSPRYLVENGEEYDHVKMTYELGSAPPISSQPTPPRGSVPAPEKTTEKPPHVPTADFFSTLEWGGEQASTTASGQNQNTQDLFSVAEPTANRSDPSVAANRPNVMKGVDLAEACEREQGIRVGREEEDEDAHKYRFDCDISSKETPIMGGHSPMQSASSTSNAPVDEFDLLGLGSSTIPAASTAQSKPTASDPFGDLLSYDSTPASSSQQKSAGNNGQNVDLFGDWTSGTGLAPSTTNPMHRNVSAPTIGNPTVSNNTFDPFAEFLSAQHSTSNPGSQHGSATNSGSTTPKPSRPNYSRSAFDAVNNAPAGANKPKVTADSFGDLLSSQGFTTSAKNATRTMGDMRRAEEIKELDPVQIKIRDWTKGKEKNIRALLGSLNDVLWDGADKWQQPPMGELLSAAQIKKWYRKACLVVHPDKQTGTPQEELAKAVFTQLNEAWTTFEEAGSPSL